jgi:hypothetical protein
MLAIHSGHVDMAVSNLTGKTKQNTRGILVAFAT